MSLSYPQYVQKEIERLRVLAREAVATAKYLSTLVPKFPAEGGPTATDRRLDELEKEIG